LDLELKNKHVLVTGSNRGTGQIIADSFAAEGAIVFYHNPDPIDRMKNSVSCFGENE